MSQEIAERTGLNPSYSYVQIGCSKGAERAMLNWARQQVGKPFSTSGMARSLIYPRETDGSSYFCAELVACCLQVGGLMSTTCRPGAATPQSLYKLYKNAGAVAANPCTLRREFGLHGGRNSPHKFNLLPTSPLGLSIGEMENIALPPPPSTTRSSSPPRMQFRQLSSARNSAPSAHPIGSLSLSLTSLSMNSRN